MVSGRRVAMMVKPRVSESLPIRIDEVVRTGLLRPGFSGNATLRWTAPDGAEPASEIVVAVSHGATGPLLRLKYAITGDSNGHEVEQAVNLTATTLASGGKRWWFACPACQARVGVLFLPVGEIHFACRRCHGLRYRSWRGTH